MNDLYLSHDDQEIIAQCMRFVLQSEALGEVEFSTLFAATFDEVVEINAAWPDSGWRPDSKRHTAINNILWMVCYGGGRHTKKQWDEWFSAPYPAMITLLERWAHSDAGAHLIFESEVDGGTPCEQPSTYDTYYNAIDENTRQQIDRAVALSRCVSELTGEACEPWGIRRPLVRFWSPERAEHCEMRFTFDSSANETLADIRQCPVCGKLFRTPIPSRAVLDHLLETWPITHEGCG